MKSLVIAAILSSTGILTVWSQTAQPGIPPSFPQASIVEQGPHSRVWQNITLETNYSGRILTKTNRYVELGSGISKFFGGRWIDAIAAILPTADGAAATNAAHTLAFLANINSSGAVTVTMPDGKRLVSNILGLSYLDAGTGQSVFIAEIKDSL